MIFACFSFTRATTALSTNVAFLQDKNLPAAEPPPSIKNSLTFLGFVID